MNNLPKINNYNLHYSVSDKNRRGDMYINSDAMNEMIFPEQYAQKAPHMEGAKRYCASMGAFVGLLSGLLMRVRDQVPAEFSSRLLCRAAQEGVAGRINSFMQYSIKGGLKYAPVAITLAIIGSTLVKRTLSEAKDSTTKELWKSLKSQVSLVPKREIATSLTLIALAVTSAVTQAVWSGSVPLLFETGDPSGHVMMQITLGAALAQSIKAASLYGDRTAVTLASSYALLSAVGNIVLLNHTAYSCHTVKELCEGLNWSIILFVGSKLMTTAPSFLKSNRERFRGVFAF